MRNYAVQISLETQTSLKAGTANNAATSCSIIMKNLTSRQLSFQSNNFRCYPKCVVCAKKP